MSQSTRLAALALTMLAGAGVIITLASADAEAGNLLRRPVEGDIAVADSRYGNGSVSGPVRQARTGYEVRLPSGTWVACRRSCSETLRVQSIDLFENEGSLTGYGTVQNECGLFGCLEIGRRR